MVIMNYFNEIGLLCMHTEAKHSQGSFRKLLDNVELRRIATTYNRTVEETNKCVVEFHNVWYND